MKEIPLHRKKNALYLDARINDSFSASFLLDTGCSGTVLSKEIADLLFLKGKLKEEDLKGYETSNWGNHYQTQQRCANIRKLSFGKLILKDIAVTICNRYGGPTLFGMSSLDKLPNYTIKKDCICIDDGKEETTQMTFKSVKKIKGFTRHCHHLLKELHKVREEHPEEDFKFDYSHWVYTIYGVITSCCEPLITKKKYKKVIEILEELRTLIKNNLEDDENDPDKKGAFITAYFNFYLASAYYQADRRQDALEYYDKARIFFLSGTPTLYEIDECSKEIREKMRKDGQKIEPKLVPMRNVTFEQDVKEHGLTKVELEDHCYGNGEVKKGHIGFKDYDEAFNFARLNRKRLEIVRRSGKDAWQRTGLIPIRKLNFSDLLDCEGYIALSTTNGVKKKAQKLLEELGEANSNLKSTIEANRDKAIAIMKDAEQFTEFISELVVDAHDLSVDSIIKPGTSIAWHDKEVAFCIFDIEGDTIAKRLVSDVLAGKIIPCAFGQMPEDFIFLGEKHIDLKPHFDGEYQANNNPEKNKEMGVFVLYDDSLLPGYGWRATYDDKIWRWEGVEQLYNGVFPTSHNKITEHHDDLIKYWQLIRQRDEQDNNCIMPEPF